MNGDSSSSDVSVSDASVSAVPVSAVSVSAAPVSAAPDGLPPEVALLSVAEVAERLAIPVSRVHQMVRDGQLLSLRRDGATVVPAEFLDDEDAVLKGLPGTITVLRDGGYHDPDILRWLFVDDPTLPGTPMASLRAGRHREVKRRAQAMAF